MLKRHQNEDVSFCGQSKSTEPSEDLGNPGDEESGNTVKNVEILVAEVIVQKSHLENTKSNLLPNLKKAIGLKALLWKVLIYEFSAISVFLQPHAVGLIQNGGEQIKLDLHLYRLQCGKEVRKFRSC